MSTRLPAGDFNFNSGLYPFPNITVKDNVWTWDNGYQAYCIGIQDGILTWTSADGATMGAPGTGFTAASEFKPGDKIVTSGTLGLSDTYTVTSTGGAAGATSGFITDGQTWTIPTTTLIPNGGISGGTVPWIPYQPIIPSVPFPAPLTVPAEDGIYNIPGGKVIVKKILITEEKLVAAMEKELEPKPTPAEIEKTRLELAEMDLYEEREI